MKTIEERKEIAIEKLMEHTGSYEYNDCWYKLDIILRIMAGWDVIKDYNSRMLNNLMFKDEK